MNLSNHISQHAEQLIIGVANKSVFAGTGTSVGSAVVAAKTNATGALMLGGLDVVEISAVVGAVVGVVGFFVSLYFQRRRDKRDADYKIQMIKLQTGQYPVVKAPADE